MQVHQMFRLVMGVIAVGGGLFILLGSLYGCLKSRNSFRKARQPVLSSIAFIALGVTNISQAFDWPHQDSYRTDMIAWPAVAVLYTSLVLLIILSRADKKAKADMGITALGEHKA